MVATTGPISTARSSARRRCARRTSGCLQQRADCGIPVNPTATSLVVRSIAGRAGLQLSAHLLRHTCVTNLVRSGNDLVLVAELAGHRRLETTRRYSLPSAADRQAAMDALEIED